jgi:hypothetical protein
MHRTVAFVISMLILITSGLTSWYIVQLTAQSQIIMHVKEPMPVAPLVVQAGDAVELLLDYQKEESVPGTVGLSLTAKGTIVPLTTWAMALPSGKHKVAVYVQIPAYAPAGNYKLYLTKQYRPSVLRDDTMLFESVSFDVVNDHRLPLAFTKPGASP